MTKKEKKTAIFDPWLIITIILVLIIAGFIFYDRSPTFKRNINYIFGIETPVVRSGTEIEFTVITDKFFPNPPYDLEEQVEDFQNEVVADYTLNILHYEDEKAQKFFNDFDIKTIPVFVFDEGITETALYADASTFFAEKNGNYLLKLTPFKYLELPPVTDGHIKGFDSDAAPITIIEYSSLTCSHCATMSDHFDRAIEEYPGQIRFVYKHFDRGGADLELAQATECAAEEGKFFEMHDVIFDNQVNLDVENLTAQLVGFAEGIGLAAESFETCIQENRYESRVNENTKEAISFGIDGTPAIFINDVFINGAVSYDGLKSILDSFN